MGNLVEEAKAGNVAGVRRELDAGANINQFDSDHDTALTWSAYLGHTEVVRLLIERGADISIPNKYGSTPLRLAIDYKHPETAEVLELSAVKPHEGWEKAGESTVAHVGVYPALNQRLTSIFNFKTRDRIVIAENIKKGTQGVSAATSFDDMPQPAVEEALAEFTRLGGTADKDYVLNGVSSLDKSKTRLKLGN